MRIPSPITLSAPLIVPYTNATGGGRENLPHPGVVAVAAWQCLPGFGYALGNGAPASFPTVHIVPRGAAQPDLRLMVQEQQAPAAASRRILVVEDEPLVRMVLSQALRDAGFSVVEAATADEALVYIEAGEPIDLIFTDIHMPGTMDGLALARRLVGHAPRIPVIVTSGNARTRPGAELGFFIPKPYSLERAVAVVHELLGEEPSDR